jgi:hypothetical protein
MAGYCVGKILQGIIHSLSKDHIKLDKNAARFRRLGSGYSTWNRDSKDNPDILKGVINRIHAC